MGGRGEGDGGKPGCCQDHAYQDALVESPGLEVLADLTRATWSQARNFTTHSCCSVFLQRTCRVIAAGTVSGYEGLGIGEELRNRFVGLAQRHKYDRALVVVTDAATLHGWHDQHDFHALVIERYASFEMRDGKGELYYPLKDLEGEYIQLQKIFVYRPCFRSFIPCYAS